MNRREIVAALVGLMSHPFLQTSLPMMADEKANAMSLIRLIANPSSFDGHRLRLAGYLDYNGLDLSVGLYVSETDGRNSILSNSIDLNLDAATAKKLIGRYVILNATFHAPKGHGSEYWNGTLANISQIKAWESGDQKSG